MFKNFSNLEFLSTYNHYGRTCSCGWEFQKKRKNFISIFLCPKHTEDLTSYIHEISEIIADALICEILHKPFTDPTIFAYLKFYLKDTCVPLSIGHLLSPFGNKSLICPTLFKGRIESFPIDKDYLPTW